MEHEHGARQELRDLFAGFQAATGDVIRKRRQEAGLSQRELADRVSEVLPDQWRQTTVAKTEMGTRPLRWVEAWAIIYALGDPNSVGITPEAMLTEVDTHAAESVIERLVPDFRKSAAFLNDKGIGGDLASVLSAGASDLENGQVTYGATQEVLKRMVAAIDEFSDENHKRLDQLDRILDDDQGDDDGQSS